MKALREREGVSSFKLYRTYDYKLDDDQTFRVFCRAKELGLIVCVHCEDDEILAYLRERFLAEGKTMAPRHPLSRPPEAEAKSVAHVLQLARQAGETNVYIVHLSTRQGLEAVRRARASGQRNIFAETCPQYLFLDDTLYDDDREGLKYIMSPPLRKPSDQEALWEGLRNGDIQTIGTDHCSFFFDPQKLRGLDDFTLCPNGVPGVELRMPLLFSEGFMKGRLTLPQVVDLCCTRPARVFGLENRKGVIAEGADADLVLFDPTVTWRVTKESLHEKTDYTPYEGMTLTGRPTLTISRGCVVAKNNQFLGEAGWGKYLARFG
jgi:dihydropyrimidinase